MGFLARGCGNHPRVATGSENPSPIARDYDAILDGVLLESNRPPRKPLDG